MHTHSTLKENFLNSWKKRNIITKCSSIGQELLVDLQVPHKWLNSNCNYYLYFCFGLFLQCIVSGSDRMGCRMQNSGGASLHCWRGSGNGRLATNLLSCQTKLRLPRACVRVCLYKRYGGDCYKLFWNEIQTAVGTLHIAMCAHFATSKLQASTALLVQEVPRRKLTSLWAGSERLFGYFKALHLAGGWRWGNQACIARTGALSFISCVTNCLNYFHFIQPPWFTGRLYARS